MMKMRWGRQYTKQVWDNNKTVFIPIKFETLKKYSIEMSRRQWVYGHWGGENWGFKFVGSQYVHDI